jgi:hypothetical protein
MVGVRMLRCMIWAQTTLIRRSMFLFLFHVVSMWRKWLKTSSINCFVFDFLANKDHPIYKTASPRRSHLASSSSPKVQVTWMCAANRHRFSHTGDMMVVPGPGTGPRSGATNASENCGACWHGTHPRGLQNRR